MQSSCWLCMQLGPPKVIEISTLVLSPTLAPAPPFRGSGSPAQPHCISCSHREVHHLLMSRPSSLAHTENFITCSHQDLHLLLTPRTPSLAHVKTFVFCSHQDINLFFTSRPSSLPHSKTFISRSHQELHLLLTLRAPWVGYTVPGETQHHSHHCFHGVVSSHFALLAVIICLTLVFFLFLHFETEIFLPFESAWSSCALPAKM